MKSAIFKTSLLLFFCFISFSVNSQNDVIHTTKGEKIICSIIKEDSAKVYFKVGGSLSSIEASLNRSEIRSIEYAPKAPEAPTLITNPEQVQRDDYVSPTSTINTNPAITPASTIKKANTVYFGVGMSAPVADFSDDVLDTNEVGPAMNGAVVNLGLSHLLTKNFGFHIHALYSNNELDTKPIASKYAYHTDSLWTAEKAYWRSFGISFGLLYYKEIKDFSFFAKINGGYLSLKYPDLKLTNHSNNYIKIESVTADAFSYGGGIGAGYKLNENLNVSLEVSYLQAHFKYNEILIQGETPGTPYTNKISMIKRDIKQTYQTLFFTIGLGYLF